MNIFSTGFQFGWKRFQNPYAESDFNETAMRPRLRNFWNMIWQCLMVWALIVMMRRCTIMMEIDGM